MIIIKLIKASNLLSSGSTYALSGTGYELLTNFQGQGIMKEAVKKAIGYAFNTIKVKKIEASLHRDNLSSIKLLEKFSFRNSNEPDKTNPDLICYHLTIQFENTLVPKSVQL